jgi:predicted nucleic acid-binding protein
MPTRPAGSATISGTAGDCHRFGETLGQLMLDCPDLYHSIPLMVRAIQISRQFYQAVYDCLYVALAEVVGCELLTADDRLIRSLQPAFPFITSLASLP